MALGARILGTVLVVGAGGLAVAALVAAPSLLRATRPVAREALRRGLKLYERVREAAAELAEDVEDIVVEVQSEIRSKSEAASGEVKKA